MTCCSYWIRGVLAPNKDISLSLGVTVPVALKRPLCKTHKFLLDICWFTSLDFKKITSITQYMSTPVGYNFCYQSTDCLQEQITYQSEFLSEHSQANTANKTSFMTLKKIIFIWNLRKCQNLYLLFQDKEVTVFKI